LTFPRLTSSACAVASPADACYLSDNNLSGLSTESLQIDDGDEYLIAGNPITLGGGGLKASPAVGATGPSGAIVAAPLKLSASQTWQIAGRSTGVGGETGLLLAGGITGPGSALTVGLSNKPLLFLPENDTEVGPVTINGANTSTIVANGIVSLLDAKLNSSDGEPVSLSHVFFAGSGAVGPLRTNAVDLDIGSPAASLEATSAKLDPASYVEFNISGEGAVAQADYSQLVSQGSIAFEDAELEVVVRPPSKTASCPTLIAGQIYTFVTTAGTLSGVFANAPEGGPEIPIRFAAACPQKSQTMQIAYHESGGEQTVTGTVEAEAFAKKTREEREIAAAKKKHEEEEASKRRLAESVERNAQEAAAKRRQEDEAAAAAASKAAEGTAGFQMSLPPLVPDAQLAATALQAGSSGNVSVKVSCPAGESSCSGTITLRTLGAVTADFASSAKVKAAVLTLASGSFTVPGGEARTVILHLSGKGRTLLARSHVLRVRATIVAHDPAGATHTSHSIVTVHAPKAKHGKG
jgi:hypothetical protein